MFLVVPTPHSARSCGAHPSVIELTELRLAARTGQHCPIRLGVISLAAGGSRRLSQTSQLDSRDIEVPDIRLSEPSSHCIFRFGSADEHGTGSEELEMEPIGASNSAPSDYRHGLTDIATPWRRTDRRVE
jgi:hypothetical protein